MKSKNIILLVGNAFNQNIEDINIFSKIQKRQFRTALIASKSYDLNKTPSQKGVARKLDFVLRCDTKDPKDIKKAILPIEKNILIVCCYFEPWMPLYARLAKLISGISVPTSESLLVCNNKLEMRKKFIKHFPEITPKFMLVSDGSAIGEISEKIGFPCITKPLNFSKSRLIMKSNNVKELEDNLSYTFGKIEEVYKKASYESNSLVLAEEFMEGSMYSVDVYIGRKKKVYFTPIVRVVTGKDIGIDDFFNYYRLVPADVDSYEEGEAQKVALKSIKAIGIANCTVHVELMKLADGSWKIIELQARPGGYRDEMLKLSYGINHHLNDFLVKMGKKPLISRKVKSYTAIFEIFPEKEGRLRSIEGIESMKKMRSFVRYKQLKKIGDLCGYSRNGYTDVLHVVLNHRQKQILHDDIGKMKGMIRLIIDPL